MESELRKLIIEYESRIMFLEQEKKLAQQEEKLTGQKPPILDGLITSILLWKVVVKDLKKIADKYSIK